MSENFQILHKRIKGIIGNNEILNHYINNFTQHLFFTNKKDSIILYKYLLITFDKLKDENTKKTLLLYLEDNYKNNNMNSLKVLKNYYNNSLN
ncbi:MAG: hypothetical protein PHV23_05255 [Candidatus Gracilibacteria bacterium]|nr:hypothetical protein [Candidatus Gracilibacteria bacterium]